MSRIVRVLAVAVLLAPACASAPATDGSIAAGVTPPVLPTSALPRMTSDATSVDADHLANEVTHPDELRTLLDDAGLVRAAQRSFGGGRGAFSRVVARGLVFETEEGAAAFVSWFGDHASQQIITSERISPSGIPDGVIVFRHLPDGCCHNDVPVFLAAWQRGESVLTLHAGGRRANVRAFVDVIAAYDREA
ncbi:MAG: hypothetical protein ACAH81_05135 [Actinomycetota bacterium]